MVVWWAVQKGVKRSVNERLFRAATDSAPSDVRRAIVGIRAFEATNSFMTSKIYNKSKIFAKKIKINSVECLKINNLYVKWDFCGSLYEWEERFKADDYVFGLWIKIKFKL